MRVSEHVMRQLQTCLPADEFDGLRQAVLRTEKDRPRLFFMIAPQLNACDYYRGFMVARELERMDLFTIRFVHALTPREAYEADLMIVYRPKDPSLLNYTADPSAQNALLMADFDDDVFSVPRANFLAVNFSPQDKQISKQVVARVNQLTVSTRRLRSLLVATQPKVSVIPNAADFTHWNKLLLCHPKQKNPRYRIGWAGTYTHTEDIIGSPFLRALDDFMVARRDVEMVFFGFCPEQFMHKHWGRVALVEPVHLYHYMATLAGMNLDLMVYPLMPHQFNYSKSNIRWLESSVLHVPVVASDIPTYKGIGEELCMTVSPHYESWLNALEYAHMNREEMRERAVRSREWVRDQWSIEALAPAWAAVFKAAASGSHVIQDFTPPMYRSTSAVIASPLIDADVDFHDEVVAAPTV